MKMIKSNEAMLKVFKRNHGVYPFNTKDTYCKWPKKNKSMRETEKSIPFYFSNKDCARTIVWNYGVGVSDWREWCTCKNQCYEHWSYEWLFYLKNIYFMQKDEHKQSTLRNLIIFNKNNEKFSYYLADANLENHKVCKKFFINVYGIGIFFCIFII